MRGREKEIKGKEGGEREREWEKAERRREGERGERARPGGGDRERVREKRGRN